MKPWLGALLPFVFAIILLTGCEREVSRPDYIARVGDSYLTANQLSSLMEAFPSVYDTTEAKEQIIEQWVTNTLLYQEAKRRRLDQNAEVKQLLQESEQSVLISALLQDLYSESTLEPSYTELQAYFERHKESLRLREPFVRIRFLGINNPDSASLARQLLQQATQSGKADSLWPEIVSRFSADVEGSMNLSRHYHSESRLFMSRPELRTWLARLRDNQISDVVFSDSLYNIIQLVERVPVGTIPRLTWIEEELRQRLSIQRRKQMYARQVQRLRNEAQAKNELEVR